MVRCSSVWGAESGQTVRTAVQRFLAVCSRPPTLMMRRAPDHREALEHRSLISRSVVRCEQIESVALVRPRSLVVTDGGQSGLLDLLGNPLVEVVEVLVGIPAREITRAIAKAVQVQQRLMQDFKIRVPQPARVRDGPGGFLISGYCASLRSPDGAGVIQTFSAKATGHLGAILQEIETVIVGSAKAPASEGALIEKVRRSFSASRTSRQPASYGTASHLCGSKVRESSLSMPRKCSL